MEKSSENTILEVNDLVKHYPVKGGVFNKVINHVKAVSGVSFQLKQGETLGVVGESGCGKSTLGRAIMNLEKVTSGSVLFNGVDLATLSGKELRKRRKDFQLIFQDPFSSLNPKMTVYQQLADPIKNFFPKIRKNELDERIKNLMIDVGLRPEYVDRLPHEFSGGQRQRISIGRALASHPKLIVCDEPVSALDVSIQSQILNLLMRLQKKYNFAYLFISHDLHVVRHISDYVAVMYLGHFVEVGRASDIFTNPMHPYTKALMSAVPSITAKKSDKKRIILQGDVPSPIDPPLGCHFHPRCSYADESCKTCGVPKAVTVNRDHTVSCIKIDSINN